MFAPLAGWVKNMTGARARRIARPEVVRVEVIRLTLCAKVYPEQEGWSTVPIPTYARIGNGESTQERSHSGPYNLLFQRHCNFAGVAPG